MYMGLFRETCVCTCVCERSSGDRVGKRTLGVGDECVQAIVWQTDETQSVVEIYVVIV
jgi:hypothetical protein